MYNLFICEGWDDDTTYLWVVSLHYPIVLTSKTHAHERSLEALKLYEAFVWITITIDVKD